MKLCFDKGKLDGNHHGTQRKGEAWNNQTIHGWTVRIVKLQALVGRRLWIYAPSGKCWNFDVYLIPTIKECAALEGAMTEPSAEPKVVTPQIEAEARHLMKVAIRAAWAYEHGLRIGRDDAVELSVYAQRLAMLLGWLPLNCNAAQSRKFQEEVSGLTFDSMAAERERAREEINMLREQIAAYQREAKARAVLEEK